MKIKNLLSAIILLSFLSGNLLAQPGYQPSEKNLQNREWFQNAKFGLFIHWGMYCQLAGGGDQGIAEWIMNQKKIPIAQYEKIPNFFNPIAFNPAEWVSMVKKAEDSDDVVVRITDLEGKDKTVTLESYKKAGEAKLTNLIEEEKETLKSDNKGVKLNLGHHAIETVKVKFQ
jgi:hypothetical protein